MSDEKVISIFRILMKISTNYVFRIFYSCFETLFCWGFLKDMVTRYQIFQKPRNQPICKKKEKILKNIKYRKFYGEFEKFNLNFVGPREHGQKCEKRIKLWGFSGRSPLILLHHFCIINFCSSLRSRACWSF